MSMYIPQSFLTFLQFSLLILTIFLCSASLFFRFSYAIYSSPKNGPPRFKQNSRMHQFSYLGDTLRLKCNALGRPTPKVHWYRNGQYMNYNYLSLNPRYKEKGWSLEIRRIEVGDRGNWTCRVWNNEDFCDYFLHSHISTNRVPEECACQWTSAKHAASKTLDDPKEKLPFTPLWRTDMDFAEFNSSRCSKYVKAAEIARFLRPIVFQPKDHPPPTTTRPVTKQQSLNSSTKKTVSQLDTATGTNSATNISNTSSSSTKKLTQDVVAVPKMKFLLRAALKHIDSKIRIASDIVDKSWEIAKKEALQTGAEDDIDFFEGQEINGKTDTDNGFSKPNAVVRKKGLKSKKLDDFYFIVATPPKKLSPRTTTSAITSISTTSPTTVTTTSPKASPIGAVWTTTKKYGALPQKVPPYFRNLEDQATTDIVIPAGRAGGQPEPQVVWKKENEEILRDTESKTGSLFHIRKWSLELDDATEADSGNYVCEVFNTAGMIVRRFRVEVQDRWRSRPIIIPNVLLDQTIDVNNTVNFTCQVISDLVPHIVWIKLIKKDGSYLRWNPKSKQHTFNFIDISTNKRARIYQDSHNKYILEISNVTMADQGLYSCIAGNTLGMSMANATLTVNEFRPMTLPTDIPFQWPISLTVLIIFSFLLLLAFLSLAFLYLFFSRKLPKTGHQNLSKMAARKKVVITKKPQRESDLWTDLASSYSITVEPTGLAKENRLGGDIGPSPHSEVSLLSDYEVPTDLNWEIDRSRLKLVEILGEGAFGEVWRGLLLPNPTDDDLLAVPVAVKKLKNAAQEKELIILVSEMQIFKSIGEHPNIIKLIGCCTGLGPLLVVLELCEYGNLRDFLRKHRPNESDVEIQEESEENEEPEGLKESYNEYLQPVRRQSVVMYQNLEGTSVILRKKLTLKDLVQFAVKIARGMDFLASKKIIHRDLAARNVLVTRNFEMKISDFGLSRNIYYQDYYRKKGAGRLPIKWLAPEALEANVYTVYSDVWSYGILLWEIMTLGGTPYPSIAMPQLYNLLKEGYRMDTPHNCPEEIYSIMVGCWQERPESRPQFHTIASYLDWILSEADNYASRSETSGGETTADESPYAVINEGNGTNRKASLARIRPMSAPGLMSFEVFASREVNNNKIPTGNNSKDDEPQGKRQCEVDTSIATTGTDENAPLISSSNSSSTDQTVLPSAVVPKFKSTPRNRKLSLIEQILGRKFNFTDKMKKRSAVSLPAVERQSCTDQCDTVVVLPSAERDEDRNVYTNTTGEIIVDTSLSQTQNKFLPMNTFATPDPSNSSAIYNNLFDSSQLYENATRRGDQILPTPSSTLQSTIFSPRKVSFVNQASFWVPISPSISISKRSESSSAIQKSESNEDQLQKKSVQSDYDYRTRVEQSPPEAINWFAHVGPSTQTAEIGGMGSSGISAGSPRSSQHSASDQHIHSIRAVKPKKQEKRLLERTQSAESHSSGRGSCAATSSGEALERHEVVNLVEKPPGGVDYAQINPLGEFPRSTL